MTHPIGSLSALPKESPGSTDEFDGQELAPEAAPVLAAAGIQALAVKLATPRTVAVTAVSAVLLLALARRLSRH